VGAAAERNTSLPPTTEEAMLGLAQQESGAMNPHVPAKERRRDPSPAAVIEQPEEAQVEDEAAAEVGIVDIASILGAPSVTVVRSTL
jgi:hypothetical protein